MNIEDCRREHEVTKAALHKAEQAHHAATEAFDADPSTRPQLVKAESQLADARRDMARSERLLNRAKDAAEAAAREAAAAVVAAARARLTPERVLSDMGRIESLVREAVAATEEAVRLRAAAKDAFDVDVQTVHGAPGSDYQATMARTEHANLFGPDLAAERALSPLRAFLRDLHDMRCRARCRVVGAGAAGSNEC